MRNTIRRYAGDAGRALAVAPVEVLVSLGLAAASSYAIESGDVEFAWLETMIVGGLVALAAWGATLTHAIGALRWPARWALTGGAVLLIILYDVALLDPQRLAEVWRSALLLVAAALALLLPPLALRHAHDREHLFRTHALRLITRVAGVALYAAALNVGLLLAIAAVDSLFDLDLREEIYLHVTAWIGLALAPWILVGGTREITAPPAPPQETAIVTRRFATYLLLPLLVIYFAILYAYVVRILVTLELPKNLVSPLVLAAGLIATAVAVLFARDERPPLPVRWAAPLFLPLAALGIWAIALRIGQYGWTENRYVRVALLLALALLAAAATLRLLRRRPVRASAVPVVLVGTLLLAAIGPWSATAVARRSQEARLRTALAAAREAGPDRVVASETCSDLNGAARYLEEHFGLQRVADLAGMPDLVDADDLAARMDLVTRPASGREGASASLPGGVPTSLLGQGTLYTVHGIWESRERGLLRWGPEYETAIATVGGEQAVADLRPLLAWLREGRGGELVPCSSPAMREPAMQERELTTAQAVVPLHAEDGARRGTLLVRQIHVGTRGTGPRPEPVDTAGPWKVRGLDGVLVWF